MSLSYHTGIFGKWHLGSAYPYRPIDRGFDEWLGHGDGGTGTVTDYWGNNLQLDFHPAVTSNWTIAFGLSGTDADWKASAWMPVENTKLRFWTSSPKLFIYGTPGVR